MLSEEQLYRKNGISTFQSKSRTIVLVVVVVVFFFPGQHVPNSVSSPVPAQFSRESRSRPACFRCPWVAWQRQRHCWGRSRRCQSRSKCPPDRGPMSEPVCLLQDRDVENNPLDCRPIMFDHGILLRNSRANQRNINHTIFKPSMLILTPPSASETSECGLRSDCFGREWSPETLLP